MSDASLAVHTTELARIFRRFFHLRHRFRAVLPEDMVKIRGQLRDLHPKGGAHSVADHELLYQIGLILSQQPMPITMGELGRELDVPLSTATRIVDWLETNGYAERQPDSDDRRVVRVALTEAGARMYRTIDEFVRGRVEGWLHHLSARERESLIAILRKLLDALEDETQNS